MTIEIDEYDQGDFTEKMGVLLFATCDQCSFSGRTVHEKVKETRWGKITLNEAHRSQHPGCNGKLHFQSRFFKYMTNTVPKS